MADDSKPSKPAPPPTQKPPEPTTVIKGHRALTPDDLIEGFRELSLIELSQFVKKFEEVFEVTAAASVVTQIGPGVIEVDADEDEQQVSFDVILAATGDKKIQVIKEVRALTLLGLGEAKALVDNVPRTVLEGASKEAAENAKAQLEAAGATVVLQ